MRTAEAAALDAMAEVLLAAGRHTSYLFEVEAELCFALARLGASYTALNRLGAALTRKERGLLEDREKLETEVEGPWVSETVKALRRVVEAVDELLDRRPERALRVMAAATGRPAEELLAEETETGTTPLAR